ncbi:MAG: hypothetical protein SFY68_15410 [Candidatus Sumerlaeia bacterium]|nr:hypothetical protein [Candidatus Sumerlaeia bacterium]
MNSPHPSGPAPKSTGAFKLSENLLPEAFFVLLILFLSCLWFARASDPDTFWGDEVYSVRLASLPIPELVERTTFDAHPPLYYLLLKGTLSLAQAAGTLPGVLEGRSSGLILLVLGTLILWWLLQPLAGRLGAVLLCALYGVSPVLMDSATEMRNYTLAIWSLSAAYLVFCRLCSLKREEPGVLLWVAYAVLGSVALWSHLLSGFVLAALGIAWLFCVPFKGDTRARFFFGGALSQGAILLGFSPWLGVIARQTEYLDQVNLSWMTDPTLGNLVRTFAVVLTFGRRPWYMIGSADWALFCGSVAVALPILFIAYGAIRRRWRWSVPVAINLLYGLLGLWVCVFHVVALWLISRLQLVEVFHAPRYPVLGFGVGLLALGFLLRGAVLQGWLNKPGVLLSLLPLLLCFSAGHTLSWNGRPYFNSLWKEFATPANIEALEAMEEGVIVFHPEELRGFFPQLNTYASVVPLSPQQKDSESPSPTHLALFPVWSFHHPQELLLHHERVEANPEAYGPDTPWMKIVPLPTGTQELPMVASSGSESGVYSLSPLDASPRNGWWRLMISPKPASRFYRLGYQETLRIPLHEGITPGEYTLTLDLESASHTTPLQLELQLGEERVPITAGESVAITLLPEHRELLLHAPLLAPGDYAEEHLHQLLNEPGAIPKNKDYWMQKQFNVVWYGGELRK